MNFKFSEIFRSSICILLICLTSFSAKALPSFCLGALSHKTSYKSQQLLFGKTLRADLDNRAALLRVPPEKQKHIFILSDLIFEGSQYVEKEIAEARGKSPFEVIDLRHQDLESRLNEIMADGSYIRTLSINFHGNSTGFTSLGYFRENKYYDLDLKIFKNYLFMPNAVIYTSGCHVCYDVWQHGRDEVFREVVDLLGIKSGWIYGNFTTGLLQTENLVVGLKKGSILRKLKSLYFMLTLPLVVVMEFAENRGYIYGFESTSRKSIVLKSRYSKFRNGLIEGSPVRIKE